MPVLLDAVSLEAPSHVPQRHRLVPVRPRSRCRLISGPCCEHEADDTSGRLIARFEAYDETGPTGSTKSGWQRYDGIGRLVDAGDLTRDEADSAGSSLFRHADPQPINRRQAR